MWLTLLVSPFVGAVAGYLAGSARFQRDIYWKANHDIYQLVLKKLTRLEFLAAEEPNRIFDMAPTMHRLEGSIRNEAARTVLDIHFKIQENKYLLSDGFVELSANMLGNFRKVDEQMKDEHGLWYEDDFAAQEDYEARCCQKVEAFAQREKAEYVRLIRAELNKDIWWRFNFFKRYSKARFKKKLE